MRHERHTALARAALALGALILVGSGRAIPGASAEEGDPEAGRALAEQWCARCHNIAPGGPMKQEPPAFAAIAAYRTPEQIRERIVAPHGGMPEIVQVLGLNADDLVAYITSLDKPAQ